MLGLQAIVIMGGRGVEVISPPNSPKCCANAGVLEKQALIVHHTSTDRVVNWVVD
jgi:hypothetical protein